jgi:hypothetical protein
MYGDAVKVVGADFEVAELTALVERALASAEPAASAGKYSASRVPASDGGEPVAP